MAGLGLAGILSKACAKGACDGALATLELFPEYKLAGEIVKGVGSELLKAFVVEPGAVAFAAWAARQGFPVFRSMKSGEQRQAPDALATMKPQEALDACQDVLKEAALPPAAKAAVEGYILSLPHAVRRGTTRFNDGGVSATMLSQLPRTESEFLRMLPRRPPYFRPGTPVAGHDYVLQEMLGQGGYGEVWKGVHSELKSMPPLAFKFFIGDPAKASLRRETSLLDKVQSGPGHAHIVALKGTSLRNEPPYVAYEYVEGGDLIAWLAALDGKAPSELHVHAILYQVASALGYAHANDIVHRDIKPGNVLVGRDGKVKVADFGIGAVARKTEHLAAQQVADSDELDSAGTPHYLDPERVNEAPDSSEDVYALGVLGVQLMLGNLTRPVPLSYARDLAAKGVNPRLTAVLQTCLDPRANRFKDGNDTATALAKLDYTVPREENEKTVSLKRKRWLSRSRIKRGARQAIDQVKSLGRTTLDVIDLMKIVADVTTTGPAPAAVKSERTLRDHPDAPLMVVLPPGRFRMGSAWSEPSRTVGEGPQHDVAIAHPVAVAKYPVTFAEWDASEPGKGRYRPNDQGWGRGGRPVINVSWEDAQTYVAWLTKLTGKSYRLLSEAEWEYACRAGVAAPFSTGASIATDRANFDARRPPESTAGAVESISAHVARTVLFKTLYRAQTTPVDTFVPNRFGLHDMHGNVWEWVEDAWHADYDDAPADGAVWTGGDANLRVLRGGSWRMGAAALRSAHRHSRQPRHRSDHVGFRVARTVDTAEGAAVASAAPGEK